MVIALRGSFIIDSLYESRKVVDAEENLLGVEIGLPIDRENCESTDISGVSTPTGTVGNHKVWFEDENNNINTGTRFLQSVRL